MKLWFALGKNLTLEPCVSEYLKVEQMESSAS